ncbi:LysR family transcriptional regulator [Clostridium tagluense]|uniref:LysR family transcriptional regulator n=1 Tax=Clostridium tagluense TaxID=360422 RepID=UPI001CF3D8B0|nr:LysR family transcriptional regulator [Clostridium tagluense]MCB2312723.1 LysR family transcriptional regulator [Clostridium tagluense]MCB2317490.1 LysR family transcriptional regulator [Clostridium tagluense]MCB2322278.1 LysR family transcriptional regulator [Clostridium tagluense]MCB2327283.1 LysR family transcriptional regulator [Clostridium tagluense]MCB2331991.1 LysR family transcriptional regulator [Clostridium tagluense]
MDIRHFKTFKSIIEEGNFSNAAMKMGYTQSTVTSQMQQLEQELSIKLFEKIGRNMVLTSLGKELIPYSNELLDTVKKIESIGKYDDNITGELKIAIAESLMSYKLQNVLSLFRQKAPNVRISIISLNCLAIKTALLKGQVDIGLMYDVGNKNDSLITIKLADFPLVLVCSPLFEQDKFDLCKPNQQIDISLIINEADCIYRKIIEGYFRDNDIFLNNTMELWSIEAIKGCVASNLGISFLPGFTVEEELENGKLKELKTGCYDTKITAIYAYHKNKWISPAMSLFMQLVRENFNIN